MRLEEAVEACVAAQPRRSVTFNEVAGKLADAREALVARLAPKAVWAGQWAGAQAEIWLTRTSAQLAAMAETVARPTAMERRIAKLADDLEAVRAAEVAYDGLSPVVMAALTEGRDTPDAEMINDRVVSEPPGTRTGRMAARSEPVVGTFADDLGLYSVRERVPTGRGEYRNRGVGCRRTAQDFCAGTGSSRSAGRGADRGSCGPESGRNRSSALISAST